VFSRDWKALGDGLLTYDDVNRREWLDLSQTILSSQFPGMDREERYQYIAVQTSSGGLFEGFTVAKSQDVVLLVQSAGIDTSTLNYAINAGPTATLGQFLGYTAEATVTPTKYAVGWLDELGGPDVERMKARIGNARLDRAGLVISHIDDTPSPPGVLLFRQAVPEPSTFWLATLCAIAVKGGSQWNDRCSY
jgi:hypothetical protein